MSQPRETTAVRRVGLASLMGTTIEYYDFFIYGTAAALVFPQLFFPAADAVTGTLLSFATYGVAFVARPLGGVVFGHFGDRVGRKTALVVTLLTMGLATVAIGLVPSYNTIGVAAPIILVILRFLQGIALGGEYGGAVLMTVEHSPVNQRGFYASWVQTGAQFGMIIANVLYLVLGSMLGDDAFLSWGWRIPFIGSVVLVIIGLVVRLRLEESPEFQALKDSSSISPAPLLEVLRRHMGPVLLIAGTALSFSVVFYAVTTWGLSYGISNGLTRNQMLTITIISAAWVIVLSIAAGALSDRVGRKPLFIAGNVTMAVLIYPWILAVRSANEGLVLLAYLAILAGYALTWATIGVMMSEAFTGSVRYTGLSLGYTIGVIVGGAITPLVLTKLVATYSSALPVVLWVAGACIISALSAIPLKSTAHQRPAQTTAGATAASEPAL
jgi:MFS family permease